MAGLLRAKVIAVTGTGSDLKDIRDELEQEVNAFLESKPNADIVSTSLESDLVLPNTAAMVVVYYRDKS